MKRYAFLPAFCLAISLGSTPSRAQSPPDIPISIENFRGLNTSVPSPFIGDNQAQDLLNVDVDYGILTKRDGFGTISSTASFSDKTAGLFTYTNQSGVNQMILCVGTTVAYGTGSNSWTVLLSTMTDGVYYDAAQAGDLFYLSNNTDPVQVYNGTVMEDADGIPSGLAIEHHDNRLWVAISSAVIHSAPVDFDNFETNISTSNAAQINIRPSDGQDVTGIASTPFGMLVFKDDSTFIIKGQGPPNDLYYLTLVSDEHGNLSNIGVKEYQGAYLWPAKRGIVAFDGSSVRLISDPIKSLWNTVSFAGTSTNFTSTDNEESEFGAGSHSGTEFNTTLDGVSLDQDKVFDDFSDGDYTSNPAWTVNEGSFSIVSNELQNDTTAGDNRISVTSTNSYGEWSWVVDSSDIQAKVTAVYIVLISDSEEIIGNGYRVRMNMFNGQWILARLEKITSGSATTLISDGSPSTRTLPTTFRVTRAEGGIWGFYINGTLIGTSSEDTHTTSDYFVIQVSETTLGFKPVRMDFDDIKVSETSGTFISATVDTNVASPTWGRFDATNTSVVSSTITYYTQTSADGSSWDSPINIVPGDFITSTSRRFIRYRAELLSDTGASEVLSVASVSWIADVPDVMPAAIENDKYLLGVKLQGSTANDRVITFHPEWGFSLYDYGVNYFTKYNNIIYHGKSGDHGVFDHSGQSDDDGVAIDAYWKSKDFNFGNAFADKTFDRAYLIAKGETVAADLDITVTAVTNSSTSNSTNNVSLQSTNPFVTRFFRFPYARYGKFVNFKFANDDESEDFSLYGFGAYGKALTVP